MPLTPRFKLSQDDESISVTIKVPYVRIANAEVLAEDCDFYFHCSPYLLKLHFPKAVKNDSEHHKAVYDMNNDHGTLTVTLPKASRGEYFPNLDLLQHLVSNHNKSKRKNDVLLVLGKDQAGYGFNEAYCNVLQEGQEELYEMFSIPDIFLFPPEERKWKMFADEILLFDEGKYLWDQFQGRFDPMYEVMQSAVPFWTTLHSKFKEEYARYRERAAAHSHVNKDEDELSSTSKPVPTPASATLPCPPPPPPDSFYDSLFPDLFSSAEREQIGRVTREKKGLELPPCPCPSYPLELLTELLFAYAYLVRFQGGEEAEDAGEGEGGGKGGESLSIEYVGGRGRGLGEGGEENDELILSFVSLCPSLRYLLPPGSFTSPPIPSPPNSSSSSCSPTPRLLPLLCLLCRRFLLSSYLSSFSLLSLLFHDVENLLRCGRRVCLLIMLKTENLLRRSRHFYLFSPLFLHDLILLLVKEGEEKGEDTGNNIKGVTERDLFDYARDFSQARKVFFSAGKGKDLLGLHLREMEGIMKEHLKSERKGGGKGGEGVVSAWDLDGERVQEILREGMGERFRRFLPPWYLMGGNGEEEKNGEGNGKGVEVVTLERVKREGEEGWEITAVTTKRKTVEKVEEENVGEENVEVKEEDKGEKEQEEEKEEEARGLLEKLKLEGGVVEKGGIDTVNSRQLASVSIVYI